MTDQTEIQDAASDAECPSAGRASFIGSEHGPFIERAGADSVPRGAEDEAGVTP